MSDKTSDMVLVGYIGHDSIYDGLRVYYPIFDSVVTHQTYHVTMSPWSWGDSTTYRVNVDDLDEQQINWTSNLSLVDGELVVVAHDKLFETMINLNAYHHNEDIAEFIAEIARWDPCRTGRFTTMNKRRYMDFANRLNNQASMTLNQAINRGNKEVADLAFVIERSLTGRSTKFGEAYSFELSRMLDTSRYYLFIGNQEAYDDNNCKIMSDTSKDRATVELLVSSRREVGKKTELSKANRQDKPFKTMRFGRRKRR